MPTEVGGKFVEINHQLIPAINIQADNVPGYLETAVGRMWFGVYFEIMFENGDLWVVHQGDIEDKPTSSYVTVEEHLDWAKTKTFECDRLWVFEDWGEFLRTYNDVRMERQEIQMMPENQPFWRDNSD